MIYQYIYNRNETYKQTKSLLNIKVLVFQIPKWEEKIVAKMEVNQFI